MYNVLIIANPASGKYNKHKLDEIISIIKEKVDNVSLALTEYRGHGEVLAKNTDADLVIAAGGDGIINEVAKGIVGTEKYFYALPLGTVNVFCKEYGIGKNPIEGAKKLKFNNIKKIPVGYIEDKLFLLMAGFGFDAAVVKKVENKGVKFKPFKTAVHLMYGFPAFFSEQYERVYIYKQGRRYGFYHGVFAVAASYAGTYKLGIIQRDMINAFIVHHSGKLALFRAFAPLFFWFGFNGKHLAAESFKIDGATFCQLDGEYVDLKNKSTYILIKKDAINFLSPK